MANWWATARRSGNAVRLFVRLQLLGFTLLAALLGAASASRSPSGLQIAGLVGASLAYHIFVYVLNDVVDLPVDRTHPRRAADPLVRGSIQRGQAFALALLQLPLIVLITAWLGGDRLAYATSGASCVLMIAYDLWGKRLRWPPLTDAAQGFGWSLLSLYGAVVTGGSPTRLTAVVCAFVVVSVVMINGVHGTLRDLQNDQRCGLHTTAILFRLRMDSDTEVSIPRAFKVYALALQALLACVTTMPIIANWPRYALLPWTISLVMVLALNIFTFLLLAGPALRSGDWQRSHVACLVHTYVSLSSIIALFLLSMDAALLVVLVLSQLLSSSWLYAHWVRRLQLWSSRVQRRIASNMPRA